MSSKKERVAIVSVVASGSLAVAKLVVGLAIGSLALISDALHSVIDLGATLVTWFAVRVADRPPDAEHHYGHGKVESVAALAESALLFLLAGGVAVEAVSRLHVGSAPVTFSVVPFVVLGIEMAVNAWRAQALLRVARETKSQALEADSLHFASDFFGSIPVVIGLALSAHGYTWGDPVGAIAVAILISALGFRMARRTVATLVDTAPEGVAESVEAAILKVPGVVTVDRVRVRVVGPRYFIDADVALPRTSAPDDFAIAKEKIRQAIDRLFDDADITITMTAVPVDSESIMDRVFVIARNKALAIHHVTVHELQGHYAVSLDLELEGHLALRTAHEMADDLEKAIEAELGPNVEVETHIEPLPAQDASGRDATPDRVQTMQAALVELAAVAGIVRDVHDVRVRESQDGELVNFHCIVDPDMSVQAVHESVDAVERALRERFPSIKRVIGHAEPMR